MCAYSANYDYAKYIPIIIDKSKDFKMIGALTRQYVTSNEVCKHFGISKPTLFRWIKNRDFPYPKIKSNPNKFDATEVAQWEDAQD